MYKLTGVTKTYAKRGGTVIAVRDVELSIADGELCVPKTSSTSCDQAIFVDQASDVSVFLDAVQVEVGRFR